MDLQDEMKATEIEMGDKFNDVIESAQEIKTAAAVAGIPPPDGGYGWVVAVASCLIQFFVLGNMYSFGVLYPVLVDAFQAPQADTAWVGSIAAALMTSIGILVGALADRYGNQSMIFIGAVLCAVGYLLASYATELWHLYLTRGFILGIGMCFAFVPAVGVVGPWFGSRRGMALGISFAGSGLGQIAFTFITNVLLDAYGWRGTMRALALINGVGIAVCGLAIRRYLPLKPKLTLQGSWETLRDRNFVLLYVAVMLNALGLFMPLIYTILYATAHGVSKSNAVMISAVSGIASIFGRIVSGFLGDYMGNLWTFKVYMILSTFAVFSWIVCTNFASIFVFNLVFAFLAGGDISLIAAVCAELFGVESLGSVLGFLMSAQAIGNLFSTPIGGALHDMTKDYLIPILVCGGFLSAGALVLLMIPSSAATATTASKLVKEDSPAPKESFLSLPLQARQVHPITPTLLSSTEEDVHHEEV